MLLDCDKFSCISHRAKILRKIATVYAYAFVCVCVFVCGCIPMYMHCGYAV